MVERLLEDIEVRLDTDYLEQKAELDTKVPAYSGILPKLLM